MTAKEQFDELRKTMKYIVKDGVYYRPIYLDVKNNICRIKEIQIPEKVADANTKTFEEASELYTIEIATEIITPDKYFLQKIQEEDVNLISTICNKRLMRYLTEHLEECQVVLDKLREFAITHSDAKVKKAAFNVYKSLCEIDDNFLKEYQNTFNMQKNKKIKKQKNPSSHKSKLYNPPVGEFGFCCEEEKMAIVFSHIRKKNLGSYDVFKRDFKTRYRYEASLVKGNDMRKLYQKYYEYAMNGKLAQIQAERRKRIHSNLSDELVEVLKEYGLRVVRADGRGTNHQVKKCRRKKQYDQDRLSGYRIISIKKGIPIAGKRYELYEENVREFVDKLKQGEIILDEVLVKESDS